MPATGSEQSEMPPRWRLSRHARRLGSIGLVLRDRSRLTDGHAQINLARLDCRPHPAQLDTRRDCRGRAGPAMVTTW